MTKNQKEIAKFMFEVVYTWGRFGMVLDDSALFYQKILKAFLTNEPVGSLTSGDTVPKKERKESDS